MIQVDPDPDPRMPADPDPGMPVGGGDSRTSGSSSPPQAAALSELMKDADTLMLELEL